MKTTKDKILITSGDPHGIGIEVILKALSDSSYAEFLIIGNKKVFSFWKKYYNLDIPLNFIMDINNIHSHFDPEQLNIVNLPYEEEIQIGKLDKKAGSFSLQCIYEAIQLIKKGLGHILITAPVSKQAIIKSYPSFTGHTEYLAEHSNNPDVTMLMLSEAIKVALVTTHVPLKQVSDHLSKEVVLKALINCRDFLNRLGKKTGKIAVCALNPHGGEGGHIGHEDSLIKEAVNEAFTKGIQVFGPFSADTLFCEVHKGTYDLYLAIYHDQGLIPFKLLSFGKGVNITLGLPFTRVSVDHGTAFDIAGKGEADIQSFKEAISWGTRLGKI